MTNKIIYILGAPGSGKNVIAEHLAEALDIVHINYREVVINAVLSYKTSSVAEILRDRQWPADVDRAYNL